MKTLTKVATLTALVGIAGIHQQAAEMASVSQASFETDGKIRLPSGYRSWVHVGTRVKVGGKNILDGKDLTTPQVLNAYIEPSAMASYTKTGKWPDGTQIVKEISTIRTGNNCDAATYLCTTEVGEGIFEGSYSGLGMMVKDRRRFATQPGYWAYFAFFRSGASYEKSSSARTPETCAACHIKLASDRDYVISQAHLALNPEGPK